MELEDFFRSRLADGYPALSKRLWCRDYSSAEAYLVSVARRREEWRRLLAPPELGAVGEPEACGWRVPDGCWVTVRLAGGLSSQGALVVPDGATRLVVFVHGLGSTPEDVFGVDGLGVYDGVGARLVEAGYAVLAPMNLIGIPARNRAQALCRLGGTTMEGLEFARFQALLEAAFALAPGLDPSGYSLAGMSWGGLAALWWAPLDDRVRAAACLGFFNHRPNKMLVQDTRYGTFHDTGEEHAFLPFLAEGFSDADLASLICPRPFLVQHGRADMIGWWPQVVEEFERAREHWNALSLGGHVTLQLHDGGHVVDGGALVEWLRNY